MIRRLPLIPLLAALALLAASSSPPLAQAPPDRPLTLEECVGLAMGQSPTERSAQFSVEAATHAAVAAKAPYYPSLGFNLTASRWQRRIFLPYDIFPPTSALPTIVGPTDDYALSLNAAYTLFDGGERKAQVGAAEARRKASQADGGRVSQDLTLSVHRAFFAYAAALDQRDVARKALERSEDHLRLARDRKAAGDAPQVDVARAESDAAEAHLTLIRAEGLVLQTRGRLATSMGLQASTPVDVSVTHEVPPPPGEAQLKDAEERAPKARPTLVAAAQTVEAARQNVSLARSAYSPKIGAAASIGREDAAWYPQDHTWYVGVSMSIPLFAGFAHREGLAKSKAELARSEADAQQLGLSVQEEVWDAYAAVLTARQAIEAAEAQVRSAKEGERLARERYAAGAGTLTSLLDAETSLARAESSRASAQWDYRSELSHFRWSYGDLTP
jgi:outer membrane protein